MAFTKKQIATLTIAFALVYFLILYFLPLDFLFAINTSQIIFPAKLAFLSSTAAIITSFFLILIFKRDFFAGQIYAFKKYRHYIKLLVKRDFTARYRKSVLGVLWSILNPLLTMTIMYIVFSNLFRFNIENFPVYLLSGQIIFGFFSESTTASMISVIAGEGVIKKVYIPKYIFPLSKMLSSLVNLGFSLIAFLFVFIITGADFTWSMLLIPLPLIYVFLFSFGIAMLMSSLSVFFRDLTYLYGVLLTLWMYLTPIFYPVTPTIPDNLLPYYGLNPLYQFIDYFRNLTLHNTIPGIWDNLVCISFALASVSVGTYVFMRKQNNFILYL